MAVRKKVVFAKFGDEGNAIEEYQIALKTAGSKILVNGKFTIGMLSAVKAFQRKNKLEVTGTIDAKTDAKLKEYVKPKNKKTTKAK